MKRYVPRLDELACLAHGDCEALAPDVFRVGELAEVEGEGSPKPSSRPRGPARPGP